MLNRAELIGRLGKDPEVRTLGNGDKVANLSIATEETWRDKGSGEKKSKTEWHRVTLWRGLADIADRYLKKGDLVYICGKIETRKWQDQSGNDRYSAAASKRK
jgi:single-strand DNA-binding protein